MKQHAVIRTSPKGKGQKFVGTCIKCGKTGLTFGNMQDEECPNVRGISDADALIEILEDSE